MTLKNEINTYKKGLWSFDALENLNLPNWDQKIHDFQEYRKLINAKDGDVLESGDQMGWSYSLYPIDETDKHFCNIQYCEKLYIEFIILDDISVLLFCKEFKEFFKEQREEYIEAKDGRFLKIESINKFWLMNLDKNDEYLYTFFCEDNLGQEVELETVRNRAFYMKNHFGFTIY